MPYRVEPIQDGAILDTAYMGHVVLDDVSALAGESVVQMNGSTRTIIHIMMDMSDIETHPTNILSMVNSVRKLAEHPKMGWWVVYGIKMPFLKVIVRVIASSKLTNLKLFATHDEALAFLTKSIDVRS